MPIAKLDSLVEEFLKEDGFIYSIKEDGSIWTKLSKRGNNLTDSWRRLDRKDSRGYVRCRYKSVYLLVHRIIYAKFIGKLDETLEINHKNGIRNDNSLSNLELISCSDNLKHKYRVLKVPASKGFKKINNDIANKIREDYATKDVSYRDLAEEYDLCRSSICYIINYKTWR